jgi:ankyrin repeat protein
MDEDGFTPLHLAAAQENSLDVAHLLIDRGANTDGIDLSWMN